MLPIAKAGQGWQGVGSVGTRYSRTFRLMAIDVVGSALLLFMAET